MERSLETLAYKGSISEAIAEAKHQKKLFVVYTSGEDAESKTIENTVWSDSKVEESLSKYCILLHLPDGSAAAANFSAIYFLHMHFADPLKSIPSITAIGYNGVQVWQNEGPVTAEFLASSLEKAWLSLHIQETTASFLTAALVSKKHETSTSGVPKVDDSEQGSSSNTNALSSTPEPSVVSKKHEPLTSGVLKVAESERGSSLDATALPSGPEASALSMLPENDCCSEMGGKEETDDVGNEIRLNPTASIPVPAESGDESVILGPDFSECEDMPTKESGLATAKNSNHFSAVPDKEKRSKDVKTETFKGSSSREGGESDGSLFVDTPTDVHLNIKLPDGNCLKEKFPLEHTLTMVKNYVDRNRSSDVGSYDLAIPYPRKVFSSKDLHKSLFELGLFDRQALILVPHQRSTGFVAEKSSSSVQMNSSSVSSVSGSGEGYFSYIRRALSFVNPFSYVGSGAGSTDTPEESRNNLWQCSPNSALRDSVSGSERSSYSPNQGSSRSGSDGKTRRLATSGIGSNIHVLKHDEDDERFGDRNPFWNGNSTQYGGNSDEK